MFRGQFHIQAPVGECRYYVREPGNDNRLALPAGFKLGGRSPVWRDAVLQVLATEAAG